MESTNESPYDPFFLDDPEMKTGKHRTVLNLPCFRVRYIYIYIYIYIIGCIYRYYYRIMFT